MTRNKDKVFVFGANDKAREYVKTLRKNGICVEAILDNDPKKEGVTFENTKICSPSIVKQNDNISIIIACNSFPEIVNQLESNGIKNLDIYLSPDEIIENNEKESEEKSIILIANGYDPFTHARVKKYYDSGIHVTVVNYRENNIGINSHKADGIRIMEMGKAELLKLLRSSNPSVILVHFISYRIATIIGLADMDDLPIIVWSHGYESTPWYRTWFEHAENELSEKLPYYIQNDIEKRAFHREWFKKRNVAWVFVSKWHRDRVKKWVGYLPEQYRVIHNYIDEEYYDVPFPEKEAVTNILSIRSHESNIYANDVVAKAIIELSNREVFEQLHFTLYGFGKLFKDDFGDLMKMDYPNVAIIRNKLTHDQMKEATKNNGVFLAPTRYDTHGVTVAEMMAAGRCVITSSIPVMLQLYDESCVSFCEGDNPWSLADEIEYLVNHQDIYISKCKKAREVIRKQCGYEATIEKEIELIEYMRIST